MSDSLPILLMSAATIGVFHTLIGPDHYLPFIVLSRAEGWPLRKTLLWTFMCGLAHVLSSTLLGCVGVGLGWALGGLKTIEGSRADWASYLLILFGLGYLVYGLWREYRGNRHAHIHHHGDGILHLHAHDHSEIQRAPVPHADPSHERLNHHHLHRKTFGTIFIIFVLGPCEPLIPLLIVPAANHSVFGVAAVSTIFAITTIGTMLTMVWLGTMGVRFLRFSFLERHLHSFAGGTIFVTGIMIKLLGI